MKSFDIAKTYKFSIKEKLIYELAEDFMSYNRKRGDYRKYLPVNSDPRKSKYWKYFEKLYDVLGSKDSFDMYTYMEAIYRNVEKEKIIFPQQLTNKSLIAKYNEHKENKQLTTTNSSTEIIMLNLAETKKNIIRLWKRKGLNKNDYESLFKPNENEVLSDGMVYCIQGKISKYFMAISKTFNKYYKLLDEDLKEELASPHELKKYRIDVKIDNYAWSFAKELFGDEVG